MIWLALLIVVLSFLCYLLVAPFYLEINSDDGLCRIRFHRLASARLQVRNSSLIIDLKIAGWKKQIDLLAARKKKKKSAQKKIEGKKKKAGISFKKIWAVVRTFRINKCDLSFDFGDMPLNGILYPLFKWLSILTGKNISVNFWNENKIIVEVENNIARIIWAFIKSSVTHKNKKS